MMESIQSMTAPPGEVAASQPSTLIDLHDRLDSLWISYLRHLDEYTSTQRALQGQMRSGFFSLSRANFNARPGMRHGKDYFHDRAVATTRIRVSENEGDDGWRPSLEVFKRTDQTPDEGRHDQSEGPTQQPSPPATPEPSNAKSLAPTLDTEPTGEEIDKGSEDELLQAPKSKPPLEEDPLRWFGILVPQELRLAQASFTTGLLENVASAVNASRAMRDAEADIRKLRKEIRRAEKAAKS